MITEIEYSNNFSRYLFHIYLRLWVSQHKIEILIIFGCRFNMKAGLQIWGPDDSGIYSSIVLTAQLRQKTCQFLVIVNVNYELSSGIRL